MAFHPDEFTPSGNLIALIVQEALQPTLRRIAVDVGESIVLRLESHVRDEHSDVGEVSSQQYQPSQPPSGVARIRVRHTARPTRDLYCVQALFDPDGIAPGTGFSGFRLSGEVLIVDGAASVKRRGETITYNDFQWVGWFW